MGAETHNNINIIVCVYSITIDLIIESWMGFQISLYIQFFKMSFECKNFLDPSWPEEVDKLCVGVLMDPKQSKMNQMDKEMVGRINMMKSSHMIELRLFDTSMQFPTPKIVIIFCPISQVYFYVLLIFLLMFSSFSFVLLSSPSP